MCGTTAIIQAFKFDDGSALRTTAIIQAIKFDDGSALRTTAIIQIVILYLDDWGYSIEA